jgi:hypothetical protein
LLLERLQAPENRRAALRAARLAGRGVARRRQGSLCSEEPADLEDLPEQGAAFLDVVERVVAQKALEGGAQGGVEESALLRAAAAGVGVRT